DRLGAHEASPARELALRRAYRSHAGGFVSLVHANRRFQGKGFAALYLDEHVDGAVLQCLEDADLGAELLARLEVLHGHIERSLYEAEALGASGDGGTVEDVLDGGERVARFAKDGIWGNPDSLKAQHGRSLAIHGLDRVDAEPCGVPVDD